ncbi:MAG: alpha/beta hydrolase, partial [Acidimicrobiia bacterium]
TRDNMDSLAVELCSHGWATWNLDYHRVGTGGGWPATLEDVAAGADRLAALAPDYDLDPGRVVLVGHSAGGHLALWAAARPHLSNGIPDPEARVHPHAVVALAPVADLEDAYARNLGDGAVAEFLRRTPQDGAERYAASSPRSLLPLGVRQVLIHGTDDIAVPVEMSRAYAAAAGEAGDTVVYRELEGVDHSSLINPKSAAGQTVIAEIDKLSAGEFLDPS